MRHYKVDTYSGWWVVLARTKRGAERDARRDGYHVREVTRATDEDVSYYRGLMGEPREVDE